MNVLNYKFFDNGVLILTGSSKFEFVNNFYIFYIDNTMIKLSPVLKAFYRLTSEDYFYIEDYKGYVKLLKENLIFDIDILKFDIIKTANIIELNYIINDDDKTEKKLIISL